MTNTSHQIHRRDSSERGVAMISSLMALLLLTVLGLAVTLSATSESTMSATYRRNDQAFFAADAGISLARETLRLQLKNAIDANAAAAQVDFPQNSGQAFDDSQLTSILTNPNLLTNAAGSPIASAVAALNVRGSVLGSFGSFNTTTSDIQLTLLGAPIIGTRPNPINGIAQPPSTVTQQYSYSITSRGNNNVASGSPYQAVAQAAESGVISITLNANVQQSTVTNPTMTRAFSSYAAFFNRFSSSGTLASGTFTGPVHTNQRFRFSSGLPVTFQGAVTQAGSPNTYDYNGTGYNVSNTNRPGLTFQSTYTTVADVPLPQNVYAQQLAVLNSTGTTDSTFTSAQPTTTQLVANLRKANNTAPGTTSGSLNAGVYVPSSDGVNITGGGIYVQGAASNVQLSVNGNGNQVYSITQGGTTTTITVVAPNGSSPGSTTISSGGSTTTFQGVPLDKSDPQNIRPGASLFVNGNISALHGPAASGGATGPALSSNTAVSVVSTGDITITGDLKYEQPVVNTDGTYASGWQNASNVLGIYTNSGVVNLTPSSTYTTGNYSLTLDAAIAAFNEPALNANSSANTGGILFNCSCSLNSNSVLTLRGSRIQSAILSIGYGGGSSGHRNVFFDPRFANGAFAPPFFPVTQLQNNSNSTTTFSASLSTSNVATQSNTWQRITY
ncbi:MAG TPA: PilX N-terminal domain-containing pilus assembly protein [Blastocatellia bacterium]|nr:PilX N-terminal domain-containing pilus assembly protein [Blastocatellia bacterium]